jgi:ACS family hexuronate transporter-like MFS transporter
MMTKKPIPHLRWWIAGLLCLATTLNYLDRQTFSVLADTIQRELGLTTTDYGKITFSFLLSYAIMYLLGGRLIDALGSRRGFTLFVSLWSVANMLHGFATTLTQLRIFRFLLGAAEPANFPAGVKAVTEWFPVRERAMAVGIFNAGSAVGSAASIPLVSWIALEWGWQAAFVVTGALGFAWLAIWVPMYRLPKDHPRLGEDERRLIFSESQPEPVGAKVPIGRLLRMWETWGCIAARVLTDPVSYFLFFWTPKYFQQERGFDLKQIGVSIWIPYVALTIGNLAGGAIPLWLGKRGWSVNGARKAVMGTISLVAMPVFCFAATHVAAPAAAIAVLAAIMFCHACWANMTLPAEVFPKHVVGTVSGLAGAVGSLVSAFMQLSIASVVERFSYAPVFVGCAVLYILAYVAVHMAIPNLGVIREVADDASETQTTG